MFPFSIKSNEQLLKQIQQNMYDGLQAAMSSVFILYIRGGENR